MIIRYKANRALNTENGLIKKGQLVPINYPRLKEAIKLGWVAEVKGKAVNIEKGTVEPPSCKDEIKESLATQSSLDETEVDEGKDEEVDEGKDEEVDEGKDEEVDETESEPLKDVSIKDYCTYLKEPQVKILREKGILNMSDLIGKDIDSLKEPVTIGKKTADKLINSCEDYYEVEV